MKNDTKSQNHLHDMHHIASLLQLLTNMYHTASLL